MSDFLTDAGPVTKSGPQVCEGVEVSEIFSSLCEGMSAEQVQGNKYCFSAEVETNHFQSLRIFYISSLFFYHVLETILSVTDEVYCLQKQEMRDEFEQVAKQLDIERELEVLSKHLTKLRELKSAVAKLTARFDVQNSEVDTSEAEMLQLASSLSDIKQKLLAEVYETLELPLVWNVNAVSHR